MNDSIIHPSSAREAARARAQSGRTSVTASGLGPLSPFSSRGMSTTSLSSPRVKFVRRGLGSEFDVASPEVAPVSEEVQAEFEARARAFAAREAVFAVQQRDFAAREAALMRDKSEDSSGNR